MKEKNNKVHKNSKTMIIIYAFVIFVIPFIPILARYVSNTINDFYSRSKEFYFYSDKLGEDFPNYQIENWSGVEDYIITVNMNSQKNNILTATYDIGYDISCNYSDNIICDLSKTAGIIRETTNTDFFNLTIIPNSPLNIGDEVWVEVTASTDSPYEKTLKAKFTLVVGQEKASYQIVDSVNSPYLTLNVTNTLPYYSVDEAFGTYNINDRISRDTYFELSDVNKEKCHSAIITLEFNPDEVLLDMTNENYLNADETSHVTKNSHEYTNSITFRVDAITSTKVRFYKIDISRDYTYPIINNNSVIEFSSR